MNTRIQSILHANGEELILEVECSLTNGLPSIIIVGLGNKSIEESKERIRSAFHHCKLPFPKKRIAINLAPADIPKNSTSYDLAIAASIMRAQHKAVRDPQPNEAFVGEVGLDGSIRPVRGIIGKILSGKKLGITHFYIPRSNVTQASLVPDTTLVPLDTLQDLYTHFFSKNDIKMCEIRSNGTIHKTLHANSIDDIVGQKHAKRALEIAAAGGHNILLSGPPGTGKSMLAKALAGLLPELEDDEVLEVTHINSLASNNYEELVTCRPFRAPHHSASRAAVIGGGQPLKPGEISLSHRGVLFLDEIPEFSRDIIEALRQPMEDGQIVIARTKETVRFPANFLLVATANPCPCGYYGSDKVCTCSASQILRYSQKISGPILDRIDLHVTVDTVEHASLLENSRDISSVQDPRDNIAATRTVQKNRFRTVSKLNASMTNSDIRQFCTMSAETKHFVDQAAAKLNISARGYMKTIKISRTIADLDSAEQIKIPHISEALQYRNSRILANN